MNIKFKMLLLLFMSQAVFCAAIIIDHMGLDFFYLREVISILFLLFIPGLSLMWFLNINVNGIEKLLYIIGLSIFTIMLCGYVSNIILLVPALIFLNVIIAVFNIIAIIRNHKFPLDYSGLFKGFNILNRNFLIGVGLLLLGILTPLINNINNDMGLILKTIYISCLIGISVTIVFRNKIEGSFHYLYIFFISLSLLYHTSLISDCLWGYDIQGEYFYANNVLKSGFWNPDIPASLNGMLSITILAPLYSLFTGLELVWVFKIIFPFIFAFVALGLFHAFSMQTNKTVGFVAALFFMYNTTYYVELNALARQQIAEYFLMLIIILVSSDTIKSFNKSILLIIFGISMAVSHYGITYLTIALIMTAATFNIINKKYKSAEHFKGVVSMPYALTLAVFSVTWYIYYSGSINFISIVNVFEQIIKTAYSDLVSVKSSQGLQIILQYNPSGLVVMEKYLHLFSIALIAVGVVFILKNRKNNIFSFNNSYILFSAVAFLLAVAGFILPYVSSQLNTTRFYHITLFYLSPFLVVGCSYLCRFGNFSNDANVLRACKYLSVFLAIFLIFNSGLVYRLTGDFSKSIAALENNNTDYPRYSQKDILSAEWIDAKRNADSFVYVDAIRWIVFLSLGSDYTKGYSNNDFKKNSYLYLVQSNIDKNEFIINKIKGTIIEKENIKLDQVKGFNNSIYNNGFSEIRF